MYSKGVQANNFLALFVGWCTALAIMTREFRHAFLHSKLGHLIRAPYNQIRLVLNHSVIVAREWLGLPRPKTYNYKLLWKMYFKKDERIVKLADKYLVRNYIKEKVGEQYLVKLLGVYGGVDEIDFDALPNQFVLKTNNACGTNIICADKSKLDIERAKEKLRKWMTIRHYGRKHNNWFYARIPIKIVCEEYIADENGDLPDYKIFCFNGKPEFIQMSMDRFKGHKICLYDTNWVKMPCGLWNYPRYEPEIPRPEKLDEMLDVARELSKEFNFVRIDLYHLGNGDIKFGEMTFFPGQPQQHYEPYEYEYKFGALMDLDKF